MFTGLIEKAGKLAATVPTGAGRRLTIEHDPWPEPLEQGESVAVHGICLTVVAAGESRFECDVLDETMARSSLARKVPGGIMNLERAMQAGARLGGHIVSGHVDGTASVVARERKGADLVFRLEADASLLRGMVFKGSVACDGVSLTIAALDARSFSVHIIPWTESHTAFGELAVGDPVNIELDMLGKFVFRYLDTIGEGGSVSMEDLKRAGFGKGE